MTGSGSGGSGWLGILQWVGLWFLGLFIGNWTKLRPAGWANKSKLLSAEMQDFDEFATQVPNFVGGSNHYAQNPVYLGGYGLILNGGLPAGAAQPLICIAYATSGADGMQATADGAGIGGRFVGGNASGTAVKGTGGAPNGFGFVGLGTGTGAGGDFTGGPGSGAGGGPGVVGAGQGAPGGSFSASAVAGGADAPGVQSTGVGAGPGATCNGGATGNGATCTSGGGNGIGCVGIGTGTGPGLAGASFGTAAGVVGIGGTGAPGGSFAGGGGSPATPNGAGVQGVGAAGASGGEFQGTTSGVGAKCIGGASGAAGLYAERGGSGTIAIECNGRLVFGSSAVPTKTADCGQDQFAAAHIPRANACVKTTSSMGVGTTTWDGVGITSITPTVAGYDVVLSHAMRDAFYSVVYSREAVAGGNVRIASTALGSKTTTTFSIVLQFIQPTGIINVEDAVVGPCAVDFVVSGRHV